jgi:hypothetical protein
VGYTRAQRDAKAGIPPRTRTGICCGHTCRRYPSRRLRDVALFRVAHLDRYRCRDCFRVECGYYP